MMFAIDRALFGCLVFAVIAVGALGCVTEVSGLDLFPDSARVDAGIPVDGGLRLTGASDLPGNDR